MENILYKIEVQARWNSSVRDEKFVMPLCWEDYYEISSYPRGDVAKRLGRMLCTSADEIYSVWVTKA